MATLAEARSTLGICNFCKAEVPKGKMTQHLKSCKQRRKNNAARDANSTKQKTWLEEDNLFVEDIPASLLDELRKVWNRDELVAFLKAKLKEIPKISSFPFTPEGRKAYVSSAKQESLLKIILVMVEDTSLDVLQGPEQKYSLEKLLSIDLQTDLQTKEVQRLYYIPH